jgi:hypothetical protein
MQIHNNTVYAIQNRVQEGWRFADTDPSDPLRFVTFDTVADARAALAEKPAVDGGRVAACLEPHPGLIAYAWLDDESRWHTFVR